MKSLYTAFGGTYREVGDYMVPDIKRPENVNTGIWGQRRARYLRTEKKMLYFNMLTNDTLNDHLEEIDKSASEMFERLVLQMIRYVLPMSIRLSRRDYCTERT